MKDYGRQKSTVRPDEMVIDDFSVWIHSDIQEFSETGTDEGDPENITYYEFNMVQYDKNEFIMQQAETNKNLQDEVTNAQIALCELYEVMNS